MSGIAERSKPGQKMLAGVAFLTALCSHKTEIRNILEGLIGTCVSRGSSAQERLEELCDKLEVGPEGPGRPFRFHEKRKRQEQ